MMNFSIDEYISFLSGKFDDCDEADPARQMYSDLLMLLRATKEDLEQREAEAVEG
jgi:hypothetical protein